ncbi:MAG TPA: formate dehydrogenase accessory protein FdhE [Bacillota bacterium]|nr:formate dehydrogenase accessory protein FdhE [Bacillota bacterium]
MDMLATVENRWKNIKARDKSVKDLAAVHKDLVKRLLMHSPSFTPIAIVEEEKEQKLAKGEYLLYGLEEQVNLDYAIPLLRNLIKWDGVGKAHKALKKWEKATSDEDIRKLLLGILRNDDQMLWNMAEQYGIETGLLSILVQYSLLPTLDRYAKGWTDGFSLDVWKQGFCPVCGSAPIISEYRDSEQFRYLRCGACGCDWLYKRLGCVNCENTKHDSLDYFYIEEEKNRCRLDVCNECKTYVKGFHTLSPQPYPLLLLEDMATLHLDLIAEEKGYFR